MKSILNLFFLLVIFSVQAQVNLDSLWGVWNDESAPDSSRAMALGEISSKGYLFSQPDSAFFFAQILYDFAENKGMKKTMADALHSQGTSFLVRGNLLEALDYFQKSLEIKKVISDKAGMAKTLNNMGLIHTNLDNYPKAIEYYRGSLRIKQELADSSGIAGAYNNIGNVYLKQSNYYEALSFYEQSLNIYEILYEKKHISGILNNIGLIYMDMEDYPMALDYFKRNLKVSNQISDKRRLAAAQNNIGLIFMNEDNYAEALKYFNKSLALREQIPDKRGVAKTLNNLGSVYVKQRMYQMALQFYERSLKIREQISDKRGMAKSMNNIGKTYYKQGNYERAKPYCEKGFQISEEINLLEEKISACQCLYDVFKSLGDENRALEYHEMKTRLDDSLGIVETVKKLQQMEFAKQVHADSLRKEEEKHQIQLAHDTEVRKKNRTRNIYIAAAILLLIFATGFHRRMVYIRKTKRIVEHEKNRSDKILLNMLPSEIAEELKEKGQADARSFDNVSILFTDFKGFTQISEKLSAEELVDQINTCFKSFDFICLKYGIEKIKTIGDSYMAAGGIPTPSKNSVKNTVLAGLEMAAFLNKKKQNEKTQNVDCFEMRVGIHTGPVVAGIVGETKFQYDIWGDAVNTASRVENAGEVGKVNLSQSTYELIRNDPIFRFQSRGEVTTKGKGDIEMWFVELNS